MGKIERRVLSKLEQSWPHTVRKTDCSPVTPRAFEAAVRILRLAGQPIASDGDGYWIARTPKELHDTADALLRRMAAVAETREALLRTADAMQAPQGTLGLTA